MLLVLLVIYGILRPLSLLGSDRYLSAGAVASRGACEFLGDGPRDFLSIDTSMCASERAHVQQAGCRFRGTTVVCVSAGLPFASGRFCGAEKIENGTSGSTFRNSEFLDDYGVGIGGGPLAGLCARVVVVIGADGNVLHTEMVSEIADEPDYDAAIAALD